MTTKNNRLTIMDLRQAMWDERFRNLFPEYEKQMREFLHNPGCACNMPLYRSLLSHKDRLQKYFPTKDIESTQEEMNRVGDNHWKVINCKRANLETELRKLPKGRKQLTVAIDGEEATVVVNELDIW